MAEEEKKKTNWFKFILNLLKLIIILIIIVAIISTIFNWFSARERMHNIYVRTISPGINYAKTNLGFMAPFFKGADILAGGKEDAFSWEETGEVKEKTGVEISELIPFGLDSKGEFGADANIMVYKFDENIEKLNVFVSCELKADELVTPEYGTIKSSRVKDLDNGKGFIIENYKGRDKEEIPIRCAFPSEERTIIKPTLRFNALYSFPSEVELDSFVVPNDISNNIFGEYENKLDLTFTELNKGIYKGYKSKVNSRMDYDADVKAVMYFERQPLTISQGNILYLQFKNSNNENKVDFKSFDIDLPDGMVLDCPYIKTLEFLDILNNQLNNEDRISESFDCLVDVNQDVFGNSKADILKAYPPIIGKLDYDNILKKEANLEPK